MANEASVNGFRGALACSAALLIPTAVVAPASPRALGWGPVDLLGRSLGGRACTAQYAAVAARLDTSTIDGVNVAA